MSRVFDEARQMDLPRLIEEHLTLRKQGRSLGSNQCPCCGESEPESNKFSVFMGRSGYYRWRCFGCGEGGTTADFFAHVWGCEPLTAARRLCKEDLVQQPLQKAARSPILENTAIINTELNAAIATIVAEAPILADASVAYLKEVRKIPEALIREAALRGLLRTLPAGKAGAEDPHETQKWLTQHLGEGRLRSAGFLNPGKKWPAIAFRPIVFVFGKTSAEFRLAHDPKEGEIKAIRYGTVTFPFWWKNEDTKKVLVVEGPIDTLSAVALGRKEMIMGLPGCQSCKPEWIKTIMQRYGDDVEFNLAMDADNAGFEATQKTALLMEECGAKWTSTTLQSAKDWNEILKQRAA